MSNLPSAITDFERSGIEKIRKTFGDELPSDLNTDFNLKRWIDGWKGDMEEIEPRLRAYIQNRKALKLDAVDLFDRPIHPIIIRFLKHASMSVRHPPLINPIDNTIVIVYRLENVDVTNIPKMFSPSEYLYSVFLTMEICFRHVMKQEAVSGKPSGLSMIYDMHGINFTDFVNPTAPHMKLGTLVMALQQNYYCNLMHQIVGVRVPGFMSILWEITKHWMNENTQKKFSMYSESKYKQHIFEHLDPSVVPVFFGGQWKEDLSTIDPKLLETLKIDQDMCCIIPVPVEESEYFKPSWQPAEWIVQHIKPKETFSVVKSIAQGDFTKAMIRWQFETNATVEFAVYFMEKPDAERKLILPKFELITPYGPEVNHLSCIDYGAGDYIFEFVNHSTSWFSLKLSYCIETCL